MKDELDGKVMEEFEGLRTKTYSYLTVFTISRNLLGKFSLNLS